MHFGVNVQCGEQRVKRAGGSVQHKGIVKAFVVAIAILSLDVLVFLVDLRGLREAGLLFVHGLSHNDPRVVFV
ncbi:hypothetical protein D3C81_913640 [compost metagenome]